MDMPRNSKLSTVRLDFRLNFFCFVLVRVCFWFKIILEMNRQDGTLKTLVYSIFKVLFVHLLNFKSRVDSAYFVLVEIL